MEENYDTLGSALVGCSGFVGKTLTRQLVFTNFYNSTNVEKIDGIPFDLAVCAAAPAQKWIANKEPEMDRENIERLISHLRTVTCNNFILISTIDVFSHPVGVDENSSIDETGLHPYGLHRRMLERFVVNHFENHLIIRLPGLVGPGLRKNVIFDFLNENNLDAIDSRSVFQFYPMVNLWCDIQTALQAKLRLVHLTTEPISVADVSEYGFGRPFRNRLDSIPARYDMRTRHAALFGAGGGYQYSRRESLQAIRAYAQSELRTLPVSSWFDS